MMKAKRHHTVQLTYTYFRNPYDVVLEKDVTKKHSWDG